MRLSQPIWPRFIPTETVLAAATLGPIGRRLPAPGTWGSLAGLFYFITLFHPFPSGQAVDPWADAIRNLAVSVVGAYLAVGFCGEAEFRLGRRDPGEVILDEFVAMPLCFLGWPALLGVASPWAICLAAFALFRLFDILKPFGIRKVQDLPAGWGVVLDDTAAAIATCAVLHLARWVWEAARH